MATTDSNIFDTAGIRLPKDACVVIVRTAWNKQVVDNLQQGAVKILNSHKVLCEVITVPGAFEIGFAIRQYYERASRKPEAFIALGCVLRGDTPHFDYVCQSVTDAVTRLNLMLPVPVIFGVLTVDNADQANDRIGGRHGHKGEEAAATALQMIHWKHSIN